MDTTDTRLLPLAAAARWLSVPTSWLRDEALAGRVPHLPAGRALLFDVEAVEAVLLERARKVPAPALAPA